MTLHEAYNALLELVREGWLLEHGVDVLVPHRTLDTEELWNVAREAWFNV